MTTDKTTDQSPKKVIDIDSNGAASAPEVVKEAQVHEAVLRMEKKLEDVEKKVDEIHTEKKGPVGRALDAADRTWYGKTCNAALRAATLAAPIVGLFFGGRTAYNKWS